MKRLFSFIACLFINFILCGNLQAYENTIYIWQRQWRSDILASLNIIDSSCQHFMILAGDFKRKDGRVGFSKTAVNWEYLKDKGIVTAVFRLHADLSFFLKNSDLKDIPLYFAQSVQTALDDAKQSGIDIAGIQLDYDCPTAKLRDFTRLLKAVKEELPPVQLSITVLPAWINNIAFRDLIASADYYVLQLHSFEIPKNQDKKLYIFPVTKAPEYFNSAIELQRPFYISLPTYGYEVAYSKDNKFLGLRAESGVEFIGKDINRKLILADPCDIVNFVQFASRSKSVYFKGVSWFRLPIESDLYNWGIKTLERVIKGEFPKTQLAVNIVDSGTNVKDVYLLNKGEVNITNEVSFDLTWEGEERPVYDVLGSFAYSDISKGIHVKGKAPMSGKKVLAAWFRGGSTQDIRISNSGVTIDENH